MTLDLRLPGSLKPIVHAASARPAYAAGVRAAIATVAPLLVGQLLDMPAMTWASLGGFGVSLVDKGGAYRTRAATQGVLTLLLAAALTLGGIAGERPGIAIPVVFAVATASSFARVYGNAAAGVGLSVATNFVVALALPATGAAAVERGVMVAIGGAWAMALSLVLWPLRPYRPARLAVGECYGALATFASHLAGGGGDEVGHQVREAVSREDRARIRETLEAARTTLAEMRRGRPGETGRGERLLVLLEVADQSFATVLALADVLETVDAAPDAATAAGRDAVLRALGGFAGTAFEVARVVEQESDDLAAPGGWGATAVHRALAHGAGEGIASGDDGAAALRRAHMEHAAALVGHLKGYASVAVETAATLEDERPVPTPAFGVTPREVVPEPRRPLLAPLRESLTFDSVAARHALRVGIMTAAAVAVTSALHLSHGYWVSLTVLVILQPYSGATWIKAGQRVVGTVLGGLIAAAIGAAIHDPLGILVVVFVLAAACVALLPINYAAYSMFLTPTFVLLAEANAGDWHLAHVRVLNTIIGGALALAGARLLWPSAGRAYLVEQMAATLDALARYLRSVVAAAGTVAGREEAAASDEVAAARRQLGLALLNAETSFQWLLAESRGRERQVEATMTILTYGRRLGAATTALATAVRTAASVPREPLAEVANAAESLLVELAGALRAGREPPPLSDEELESAEARAASTAETHPLVAAQTGRVWRQLATLRSAVARFAGAEADTQSRARSALAFR